MSVQATSLRNVLSARPATEAAEGEPAPRLWDRASSGRVALAHFALSGLMLLVVVATIGAVALRGAARDEALRDARALTAALTHGVIQGQVTPAVLAGDPAALDNLDRIVHTRVLAVTSDDDSPIVRVKVWTSDGRIVYSDASGLVGRRFALPEDLREAMASRKASADVSDLDRPENRYERGKGRLVEVYQPMTVAGGRRVLLEAYHPASRIDEAGRRIERSFLPLALALLVALALAQLPLAWFLARRVRSDERARERLRHAGEDALESERLRIAAELHDGVVQDLAGVAYELQAAADRLAEEGDGDDPELDESLRRGADVCRGSMRAIRGLLVDLYPSTPREQALDAAVEALARPLRQRGVAVEIDVHPSDGLPRSIQELVYRTVQEALRNVDRHAAARTASVTLHEDADGSGVTVTVVDDGRGMTGDTLRDSHAAGHMGLALLADGVAARGGSVAIESEPGSGTRVIVRLPRDDATPAAAQAGTPAGLSTPR